MNTRFIDGMLCGTINDALRYGQEAEQKVQLVAKQYNSLIKIVNYFGSVDEAIEILSEMGSTCGDRFMMLDFSNILRDGQIGFPIYKSEVECIQ